MSMIAKSLKRLKNSKKPSFNITGSKKRTIDVLSLSTLLYFIFIIAFVVIVSGYGYISFKYVGRRINSINFPSIFSLQNAFEHEKQLVLNTKVQPKGLDDLFILKQFDKMFKIAKEKENLKYEGLYYFEKNNLDQALLFFKSYMKNHPQDYIVKAYIAFILYRERRYYGALNILDSIKSSSCNIIFDRAVVSEASGRYKPALNLYKEAYKKCRNPVMLGKIKKKIIVLEYYLRNINES